MFCTNCGANLPDGSQFCTNCGSRVEAASATVPVSEPIPTATPAPAPRKPARRLIIKADEPVESHTKSTAFTSAPTVVGDAAERPVYREPAPEPVYAAPAPVYEVPAPVTPPAPAAPAWPEYAEPVKEAAPVWPEYAPPAEAAAPVYTPPVPPAAPMYEPPVAPGPEAPVSKAAATRAEKAAKKKKKSALPVILALLLVVAIGGAAVWYFFLGGDDVVDLPSLGGDSRFLLTEYTYESADGYSSSTTIEYGDDGEMLTYVQEYEQTGEYSYEGGMECSYEYEDGLLVAATIERDGIEMELTYEYEDDVLVEVTGEGENGTELIAECDDEGRIETIEITYADGQPDRVITYSYDDDGNVEECVTEQGTSKSVSIYEDGALVEETTYQDGEEYNKFVCEYDENGNQILMESYHAGVLIYTYEYEYTYDGDEIVSEVQRLIYEDGTEYEVEIEFEWDDNIQTITYSGDVEEMGVGSFAYIEREFDDDDNLIRTTDYDEDDEVVAEVLYTYKEFKGDDVRYISDPIYFVNIYF